MTAPADPTRRRVVAIWSALDAHTNGETGEAIGQLDLLIDNAAAAAMTAADNRLAELLHGAHVEEREADRRSRYTDRDYWIAYADGVESARRQLNP